jgi:hypothetical protein
VSDDRPRSESADTQEKLREEIDNPIERLRLLSGDDDEIAKYLDALEVTSPREGEMMQEIARTQPLARPERFPEAHRNVVEALESLARHGYHGASSRSRIGPARSFAGGSSWLRGSSSSRTFPTFRPRSGSSTPSGRSRRSPGASNATS